MLTFCHNPVIQEKCKGARDTLKNFQGLHDTSTVVEKKQMIEQWLKEQFIQFLNLGARNEGGGNIRCKK